LNKAFDGGDGIVAVFLYYRRVFETILVIIVEKN